MLDNQNNIPEQNDSDIKSPETQENLNTQDEPTVCEDITDPVEEAPVEEISVEEAPAEDTTTEEAPAKEAPANDETV